MTRLFFTFYLLLAATFTSNIAVAAPVKSKSAPHVKAEKNTSGKKKTVKKASLKTEKATKTVSAATKKKKSTLPESKTAAKKITRTARADNAAQRKSSTTKAARKTHTAASLASQSATKKTAKNKKSTAKTRQTAQLIPIKKGYKKDVVRSYRKSTLPLFSASADKAISYHDQQSYAVRQAALKRLLAQLGKPYRWGGASPATGFDCSGLVYYAYKDLVNINLPRTANEMFHLRDAAPVNFNELEIGDLVFFRINNRGSADHVGVYMGNGKFIQSPRTGKDIRISQLTEQYWKSHFVGARRLILARNIR